MWRTLVILAAVAVAGCGQSSHMVRPAPAGVDIAVTERGFEPATITVTRGQPVRLTVMRVTDMTCARQFVMPGHGIRKDLPLGQPVEIGFTCEQAGETSFTCDMNMMSGMVVAK